MAKMARIPEKSVSSSDKDILQKLDSKMKLLVFGQDQAIDVLSESIKLSRAGLGAENKPVVHSCSQVLQVWVKQR